MKRIRRLLKNDWYILLMIVAGFLLGSFFYPRLPVSVPIHWDSAGHVNGYGSRAFGAFAQPCIALGLYLIFCVLPFIDPRARNYEKFNSSYQMVKCLIVMLFLAIQACMLLAGIGVKIDISIITSLSISILFVLLGNVMGRFRQNYFVGFRTPWTLANEQVWRKTHRFAGPVWVLGGLANLVLTLIGGDLVVIGGLIVVSVLVILPYIYSYLVFRHIGGDEH